MLGDGAAVDAEGVDHLLEFLAHLAPAAGLEEGGGGAGAVAGVTICS